MPSSLHNLEQMLEHIADLAEDQERVSVREVVESVGERSFGPLLLVMGVTLFSPISGIPGMAIFAGLFLLLIASQLLLGRRYFWLPRFILQQSVAQQKLLKAMDWVQPYARRIDKLAKPRLEFMVRRSSTYLIAGLCLILGAALPFLELVPFSSTMVGLALAMLGLALVARDGLLVMFALTFTATAGTLAASTLLG